MRTRDSSPERRTTHLSVGFTADPRDARSHINWCNQTWLQKGKKKNTKKDHYHWLAMAIAYPVWLGAIRIRSIQLVMLPCLLTLNGSCEKLHCIPNFRSGCLQLKAYLYNMYRIHTLPFSHVLHLIWLFSAALNFNVMLLFTELLIHYYWRSLTYT